MIVIMTLSEILQTCSNWEHFCEKEGFNEYAVNEGGNDVEVYLTREKCMAYGIIKE